MSLKYIFAAFTVLVIAIACRKSNNDDSAISLGVNECEWRNNNFKICVDSLIDTRCPDDVTCIHGGTAYGVFTVTANTNSHTFILRPKAFSSNTSITDTSLAGYRVEFYDIIPHRLWSAPFTPQKARLRITKI